MDPALIHLIEQAQAGVQFPPIKILAGGTLFIGHLGTEAQATERFQYGLGETLFNEVGPRKHREADAVAEQSIAQARQLAAPLLPSLHGGSEAFALLNCQVWSGGGGGVEVAAVRILYAAVEAWWLGAQAALGQSGGGGFFGGVLVPLDGSD